MCSFQRSCLSNCMPRLVTELACGMIVFPNFMTAISLSVEVNYNRAGLVAVADDLYVWFWPLQVGPHHWTWQLVPVNGWRYYFGVWDSWFANGEFPVWRLCWVDDLGWEVVSLLAGGRSHSCSSRGVRVGLFVIGVYYRGLVSVVF